MLFFSMLAALLSARADDAPPGPAAMSLDAFKSDHPPFSFTYDGRESDQFIVKWTRDEKDLPSEGGMLHRFIWSDPATRLKVTADVRTFNDYPAIEWVMHFANEGTSDTPIIERIKPLHWNDLLPGGNPMIHFSHGSQGNPMDFEPVNDRFNGTYRIESGGSSSVQNLPISNLQSGDYGVICAVGWSGNWMTEYTSNAGRTATSVSSGMHSTHLLLHAGEEIRTPRILLLPWHGDIMDAQNLWRRLALAYYSPRGKGGKPVKVPICWGTWGGESIDKKLAVLTALQKLKAGFEVYWVDAGWFGDSAKDWNANRGSWDPSPILFPHGLAPLGEAAKKAGMKLLLWMAPEQARPGTTLYTQHPEWFYPALRYTNPPLVRLGNPAVLKSITDMVYKTMTTAGATWFRQDGDADYIGAWASDEKPDRIGMDEIQYFTNFYAFWDALRARIPDLQIDNCNSGGKCLDLETMSRSVSLWRSDSMVNPYDPSMEPMQAQGLIPWVPLSGGVWVFDKNLAPDDSRQLYRERSGYCAGLDVGGDSPPAWLKSSIDEYKEVQPYFYGDFYPLLEYSSTLDSWSIWQLDRPDLKSGVVMMLRRSKSPFASANLPLHAIDPTSEYEVEVRLSLDKVPPKRMTGKDFLNLVVAVPDQPGSALVFYKKL